jgi:hypothetical protein
MKRPPKDRKIALRTIHDRRRRLLQPSAFLNEDDIFIHPNSARSFPHISPHNASPYINQKTSGFPWWCLEGRGAVALGDGRLLYHSPVGMSVGGECAA